VSGSVCVCLSVLRCANVFARTCVRVCVGKDRTQSMCQDPFVLLSAARCVTSWTTSI
jgi:hypothetical protein